MGSRRGFAPAGAISLALVVVALAVPAAASAEPTVSISDASIIEGLTVHVRVTRSGTAVELNTTSTVAYATADNTAVKSTGDYGDATDDDGVSSGSPLVFGPNVTELNILVPTHPDASVEGDEFFFVDLIHTVPPGPPPVNAQIGDDSATVRILDDTMASPVQTSPLLPASPPAACANVIAGTRDSDRIIGTEAGDKIKGRGGSDRISGLGGDDCITGGGDKDKIYVSGGGVDTVNCGPGIDTVRLGTEDPRSRGCETVRG